MADETRNPAERSLGDPVPGWRPVPIPSRAPMIGRFCRLESLDPVGHAQSLAKANEADTEGAMWTYLPYGPFEQVEAYEAWLRSVSALKDPMFFAIVPVTLGRAAGLASYLRMDPSNGSIEVGHLAYSPILQRTP